MKEHKQVWYLSDEKWNEFMALLEAPATDMPKLRQLLTEPAIFDKKKP